jgi:hypothetical protein
MGGDSGVVRDGGRDSDGRSAPASTAGLVGLCATFAIPEAGCPGCDEPERKRLMADIMRVLNESPVPEAARIAGLTLIGWLARRRMDEAPHAVGIPEARESEQRLRSKAR